MNNGSTTREPPKPKAILATPLNVEESRAQRQQRSQARFRDRGGIFVPSNRNTLADILLGKAEPLKRPRRSVSASPLGHLHKGPSVTQIRRISSPTKHTTARKGSRSPQKQSRRSNHGDERVKAIERSHSRSPQKPFASTSTLKPKSKAAAKPPKAKLLTASKKASTHDESGNETDVAPPKPKPKPKPRAKSKAPSKSSKALPEVIDETDDDVVPLKPKDKAAKTTKASKTKNPKPLDKPAENPKSKPSRHLPKSSNPLPDAISAEVFSSSATSQRITEPRRSRGKASDLYSGASEDEYVPKTSKSKSKPKPKTQASTIKSSTSDKVKGVAKPSQKQTKPSGHLSDILEEEEEEEALPTRNWSPPRQISAKLSKASTSQTVKRVESVKGKKHLAKDVSEDDEPRKPPTKRTKAVVDAGKQVNPNTKEKSKSKATPSEAMKGKKRSAQEDDSELDTQPPTKRSKAALDKESISTPKPKSKSKETAAPAKGKKRSIPADESPDEPVQPPSKRAKAIDDDKAESSSKSSAKASKTKTTARAAIKKRPRGQDDGAAAEMAVGRSTKRKKSMSEIETAPEKTATVPVRAQKSGSKKPPGKVVKLLASGKAAETAKRKENNSESGRAAANVVSNKRGPPKSVLERLKARDQPHIIDNDPDPIDFLS